MWSVTGKKAEKREGPQFFARNTERGREAGRPRSPAVFPGKASGGVIG